ncbi:MAG: hypothetical protein CSB55_01580 [Candidatus Cloacimonadota bacterium]|nr:MAG: hypothetical protein CSB55_01580 [Candidatus Cloacimonadota bacterium]
MKKNIFILSLLIFVNLFCETIKVSDYETKAIILNETQNEITMRFTTGEIDVEDIGIGNKVYHKISIENEVKTKDAGFPELPLISRSFGKNQSGKWTFEILDSKEINLNLQPVPSKGFINKSQNRDEVKYSFENYDKNYPESPIELRNSCILRNKFGQNFAFLPLRYNAETDDVSCTYYLDVKFTFEPDNNFVSERNTETLPFQKIYENRFINSVDSRYEEISGQGEMLIVTPSEYENAIREFAKEKTRSGIPTTIVSLNETGNTYESIRSYLINYYEDHPLLVYLLLIGDAEDLPSGTVSGKGADNLYGMLVGNDAYPELIVGRFSASNQEELAGMITRTLEYETASVAGDWYSKATGIASDQGTGDDNESDDEHAENIRNQLLNYTYSSVDQIYDPGASAEQVSNALNEGRSLVTYTGHGLSQSWTTSGFNNDHINDLINKNKLPAINSAACYNGDFVGQTCFGEAWLRASSDGEPTGALAFYGSSISQPWDPPMSAQDETVDLICGGEVYHSGALLFNGICKMLDDYGDGANNTAKTWIHFGDPSLRLRTTSPIIQNPVYPEAVLPSSETFNLSNLTPGSYVSLYDENNQNITGNFVGESGNLTLSGIENFIPGTDVYLQITGYNLKTYFATLPVLNNSMPFISFAGYSVEDEDLSLENGDIVSLALELVNNGNATAENILVSVSCNDPYITVDHGSFNVSSIAPGYTHIEESAVGITVSPSTPDQHETLFEIVCVTEGYTTESNFYTTVNAPVLEISSMYFYDTGQEANGMFSPGETGAVHIEFTNTGHREAVNANCRLIIEDEFIFFNQLRNEIPFLGINESANFTVGFQISEDAPVNHTTEAAIKLFESSGFEETYDGFHFTIGVPPLAIIELDKTPITGEFFKSVLDAENIPYDDLTAFPQNIGIYKALAILLGVYNQNEHLDETEAGSLTAYMDNGGCVYMEGGDCWGYDAVNTILNPYFGILSAEDGSSDFSGAVGQTGTFTADMNFENYSGENTFMDIMTPKNNATVIFKNSDPVYVNGVFYEENNYKTVGLGFELGGLEDADEVSSKSNLIKKILTEFNIIKPSDQPYQPGDIDQNNEIQAFDASLVLRYAVGFDPLPEIDPLPWEDWRQESADVSGNGEVTAYDASLILQYVAGIINDFSSSEENDARIIFEIYYQNGNIVIDIITPDNLLSWQVNLPHSAEISGETSASGNGALEINKDSGKIAFATAEYSSENNKITIPVKSYSENIKLEFMYNELSFSKTLKIPDSDVCEYKNRINSVYPNPFNPDEERNGIKINYELEGDGKSEIGIFNVKGQKVKSFCSERGKQEIVWDGKSDDGKKVGTGVYFIMLKQKNKNIDCRKMMILK